MIVIMGVIMAARTFAGTIGMTMTMTMTTAAGMTAMTIVAMDGVTTTGIVAMRIAGATCKAVSISDVSIAADT